MKVAYSWLLFCFALALVSCTPKPEAPIIGKWKATDGGSTIEFFQDGTVRIKGDTGFGIKLGDSTFKVLDGGRIKIDGGLGMEFKISVSQEDLTLTDPQGKAWKYKKVKWFE